MSISFRHKSNNPIAYVEGGELNKKVLYLHEEKHQGQENYFDRVVLDDGTFFVHPEVRIGQTDRIALVGSPGARKSTWIAKYLKIFHVVFPDALPTILFTTQNEEDFDRAFKDLEKNILFMHIDESMTEERIELNDMCKKSGERYLPRCIVFDDYVGSTRKITEEVERLRNAVACNGRKLNFTQIVAQTDLPVKSGSYREFLSNCTHMVAFPSFAPVNLKYTLTNYFNIPENVWKVYKKQSSSRWICFTRTGIPFIMSETICTVFDADDEIAQLKEAEAMRKKQLKDRFDNMHDY
jgi:hypothetical protein